MEKGKRVLAEVRKVSSVPIRAIVYSHWHTDHYAGVKAFVSQEEVDRGECAIIAHQDFMDNVIANSVAGDGPIIAGRLDYSLGTLLEVGPAGRVNGGLGPGFVMRTISLIPPTIPVADHLEHTVAGVRMVHTWAPSEAIDEIITWFPGLKVLQSAEVIQGESFPSLHSIRGSRYRDPQQWFKSIDRHLRPLPAEFMLPSHGRPVAGRKQVAGVLRDYRDAISFTYDQTLRYMNLGFLPDDLVEKVQLPPHLAAMPAPALLDGLPFRVDPAACGDVAESIGVLVTDTQEEVGLIVRHGVMEPVESVPSGATVIIRAPRAVIIAMLLRGLYDTLAQAVETGQAELSHGGLDDARRFFSYFDPVNAAALKLADR